MRSYEDVGFCSSEMEFSLIGISICNCLFLLLILLVDFNVGDFVFILYGEDFTIKFTISL